MLRKITKIGLITLNAFFALIGIFTFAILIWFTVECDNHVSDNSEGRIYSSVDSIPHQTLAVIISSTPQPQKNIEDNPFLMARLNAAEALYNADKIGCFLVAGGQISNSMKDSLVARGIPDYLIRTDTAATDIFNSVARAIIKYSAEKFTIISHEQDNEKALYFINFFHYNVDEVQAFNANPSFFDTSIATKLKENFDRTYIPITSPVHKQSDDFGYSYDLVFDIWRDELLERRILNNSVAGHNEQDTIVGNFTGCGIDTLYVETKKKKTDYGEYVYYLASNNPKIPRIKLYGCDEFQPRLVNEGDLDGNGTVEVGYLRTWLNSQWRDYRIFTLVDRKWRYLVEGEYLSTQYDFRQSGTEVAEPGKEKGTVLIHYLTTYYDKVKDERISEIRDTIVRPTFNRITD